MIRVLSAKKAKLTQAQQKKIHRILTIAYAETEIEVWGDNYQRITFDDYLDLIEKDEILVAFYQGEVVGGIHYYQRNATHYAFSLLCADFSKKGLGIGRALVGQVEKIAKANKAKAIQIEILRAKEIEVTFKKRLSDWYQRMGYIYTHSQNFAEVYPEKSINLANPSNFDYYRKVLD